MNPHEPGDLLARRYRLLEPIATGEASVLWRARDEALDRLVAVKVLPDQGPHHGAQHGPDHRELARKEARTTARLEHPDAIEVYDYGETVTARGRVAAFVVMRLLDGVPLAERLCEGPLPWARATLVAVRVARVLAAAHEQGIVHRDVSAKNVLLTAAGPKLLDFGIAAPAGDPDDARGTPPYVAPERLAGAPAHPAVDVYALGVLYFQMLTGVTPYPETTWEQLEQAHRGWPSPRPAGVRADLADLCQRCLSPVPADRPAARDVAERLSRALTRSKTTQTVRRGLGVAALASLVGVAGWLGIVGRLPYDIEQRAAAPSPTAPAPSPTGAAASPTDVAAGPTDAAPSSTEAAVSSGDRVVVTPRPEVEWVWQPVASGADRFRAVLDAGVTTGEVRPDVALDLRQTLAHVSGGPGARELGRKVDDRLREGGLSPRVAGTLRGLLTSLP